MDRDVTVNLGLTSNGATLDTSATTHTISGNLTDDGSPGRITVTGGGTIVLTGTNTYTGGTTVTGNATVTVSGTNALGTGGLTLNNGGLTTTGDLSTAQTVSLRNANNVINTGDNRVALSGTIDGDGGITFTGGNQVTLTGTNSYTGGTTITGNTTVTVAGTNALGQGGITLNGGSLATTQPLSTDQPVTVTGSSNVINTGNQVIRLSGNVGGGGALTVVGGSRLTLNGVNDFTGSLRVTDGTLLTVGNADGGSLSGCSGVLVQNRSTLGGTGTVCGATIDPTGTIAPGNSIGTLTVAGNLNLLSGSRTAIEISRTSADRIAVNGSAILDGTLAVSCENGTCSTTAPIVFGTTQTVLTTGGTLTGSYASITSQVPGMRFEALYGANAVRVTATPENLADLSAGGVRLGQNQVAVAQALNRVRPAAGTRLSGSANTFFQTLYTQSATGLATTYAGLDGELHAAVGPLAAQSTSLLTSAALSDWRRRPAGQSDATSGARVRVAGEDSALLWAAPVATQTRFSGDSTVGSNRRTGRLAGYVLGLDTNAWDNITIGAGFAALDGRNTVSDGLGEATTKEKHGLAYASAQLAGVTLGGATSYGRVDVKANRSVTAVGAATAVYQANVWSGRFTAAYPLTTVGDFAVDPFLGVDATSARVPGFREAQTAVGTLSVAARTNWTSRADLGLRASTRGDVAGLPLRGSVSAAYRRYLQQDAAFTGTLNGLSGSSFVVRAGRQASNVASVGTSLGLSLQRLTIDAQVDGEVSSRATGVGGSARVSYRF